jgi:hypothetical protein
MDAALPRRHLINTTQARQEDKLSARIELERAKNANWSKIIKCIL